jgi:uncharacterized membrane protein YvbJ
MKKCPACGLSNNDNTVKCRGCGYNMKYLPLDDDIITGC